METFLISLIQVALGVVNCDSQVNLPTSPYVVYEPHFLLASLIYSGSFNNNFTGCKVLLYCLSFCSHYFTKCYFDMRYTVPIRILNVKAEKLSSLKMESDLHRFKVSINIWHKPYLTPCSLLFVILGNLANTITDVEVFGINVQQNLRLEICIYHY